MTAFTPETWPERYIGWDGDGVDPTENCWKFVRRVLFSEAGVILPLYQVHEDTSAALVQQESLSGRWVPATIPQAGDVVVFRVTPTKTHIGIMVDANRVLHYKDVQTGAVIELIRGITLARRVEGYWRHANY